MLESRPEAAVPQLIRTLEFLSALDAQLRDTPDLDAMAVDKFGLLVPPGVISADAPRDLVARLSKAASERELLQALLIESVTTVLRELIERWEFTQSIPVSSLQDFGMGKPHLAEQDLKAQLTSLGIQLEDVAEALMLAREVHGAATRDDGAPYLEEHVFPVAREVAAYLSARPDVKPDQVVAGTVTAILHDALEDAIPETEEDVRRRIQAAYGTEILRAVETLTKKPKAYYAGLSAEDAKSRREDEYMHAVRDAPSLVRLVKVFDRINNLQCVHASPVPGRVQEYAEETRKYHLPLASQLDPALAGAMREVIDRLMAKD